MKKRESLHVFAPQHAVGVIQSHHQDTHLCTIGEGVVGFMRKRLTVVE
jgi:hypothetical protein